MIHPEAKIGEGTKIYQPELSNIREQVKIGKNCIIHSHVWIGARVLIGNNVKIQAFTFIPEGVVIEDNVFLAPHTTFTNDPKLSIKGPMGWESTMVRKGAKIGAGALIKAGIEIGEGAIIGMGAVVTKNVPAGETWVGNPARKMKIGWLQRLRRLLTG